MQQPPFTALEADGEPWEPRPITDDSWSADDVAACLPPSLLAARQRVLAGEEAER